MISIEKLAGKSFGPINDPDSHKAKLRRARKIPPATIENGKDKRKAVADSTDKNYQEKKKKEHFIQKYTEQNIVAEAVVVAGIPYFAVAKSNSNEITVEKSLSIDDVCEYKPFEQTTYLSEPYKFKSKQDFELCLVKARDETLDTLYGKVESIWRKYIDADDFHISICTADTIFTYYQDKMGLTHYLFFIGGNNCGKSNNLLVLKYLAYRNFTSTDMTAANIYQFLGSGEEGQGTLCEDEADRIDDDRQKMAIHKNGYIKGFSVARTDTSFGRKQMKFNTYCFKAFAAERFPDPVKAKGFNQRVIEMQCSSGNPHYDIAEVTSPAGAEEFQGLVDELNETRNLLLAFRLLHFHDHLPDIKLNIKGREKQLFKPVLRIFQNTQVLNRLLPVISNYVAQKREANYSTLHAFLYRTVKDMITSKTASEIESGAIWESIKASLPGDDVPGRTLSYETSEFGTITQKEIIQTLQHIFGAKSKKSHGIRILSFDVSKLRRLGNVYDLPPQVMVVEGEDDDNRGSDMSDWTDVGLDRHIATRKKVNEKSPDMPISERYNTPFYPDVDTPHPSNASNTTPTQQLPLNPQFKCYHRGCHFHTNDEREYRRHGAVKHVSNPLLFPSKAEIEKYGLQAQRKDWEI
jgi:hypothetical protein